MVVQFSWGHAQDFTELLYGAAFPFAIEDAYLLQDIQPQRIAERFEGFQVGDFESFRYLKFIHHLYFSNHFFLLHHLNILK